MKGTALTLLCLGCFLSDLRAQLFSDNFTRGSDPGPLTPWTAQAGSWIVTGGTMQATNFTFNYSDAYITNSWTNYSVQVRMRFPVGAFGGGLGGRLNPATGSHYAAWVYPENSPGGSNMLKLIKFQSYTTFGYNGSGGVPMQQVSLAAVGTNFHTVRMDFQDNQIKVSFDGTNMITTSDIEAQPYTSGSVGLDTWTDASAYTLIFDDVLVNAIPLVASNDTYTVVSGFPLTVSAPGVLSNDSGGSGPLNVTLATGVPMAL